MATQIIGLVIAAKRFHKRAHHRVTKQIEGEDLAVECFPAKPPGEQRVEPEIEQRFVYLGGVHSIRMGFVAVRKLNRPGQTADAAVAASVHQATDPTKGVPERDAGREDVGHFPERKLLAPDIKDAGDRGADESAVKNHSAGSDI